MNYEKLYEKIIAKAKSENRKKGEGIYYEEHHIKPKSIFPELAKDKDNLVLLTAREHFFCHQLLTKIYATGQEHIKMAHAAWRLCVDGQNNSVTSREYERIKVERAAILAEQMKGNTFGWQKGKPSPMKGKKTGKHSWNYGLKMKTEEEYEETRQRALERQRQRRYKTPEQKAEIERLRREKISKTLKGTSKSDAEAYKKSARARYKGPKIKCIETEEVFDNLAEIIDKYPFLNKPHILGVCKGMRHYHGKLNDVKLHWEYVD